MIHRTAIVEGADFGEDAHVGPYAVVAAGVRAGAGCAIGAHCTLGEGVALGQRVSLGAGARVGPGVRLEDDVSVGENVTIAARTLGGNALVVGRCARVEPGTVLCRDVPPHAVVAGNPATITGYVETEEREASAAPPPSAGSQELGVGDVQLFRNPIITDLRGSLTFGERGNPLPFAPQRYFLVFDVPGEEVRGEHAHKTCGQYLVCIRGACSVVVDDGETRAEVRLDSPSLGLYVPPLVWAIQYKYTRGSELLVLASDVYDPDDYIRNYDDYLAIIGKAAD